VALTRRALWARREDSGTAQARTTLLGVFALQVIANGLGFALVVLYVRFLIPRTEIGQPSVNLVVFSIFMATLVVIELPLNLLLLRRAVAWVRMGTPPTERQRRLVFWLPLAETLTAFVTWLAAAVIFGLLNEHARRASMGIVLAGIVTCTLLYLLLEGHFRPVFALALADGDLPENRRDVLPRLLLAWLLGSAIPLVALGLSPMLGPIPHESERLLWLAGAGVIGGGAVMIVAAISVARPIGRVREALRRVEHGDLDVHVPVDDLGELGRLAEGVNDLVDGMRERDAIRDLFTKQVGQTDLADLATAAGVGSPGQSREVTVLFVDLRGYTRYAEQHQPSEVVEMLNRFFSVVVAVVAREGGWINKFEGDAALCLFGAPQDEPDHAARGLRAALAIPRELAREPDVLPSGVGVASGSVIAGFVGTTDRFEYTVIGDVVNIASRLCEEAKTTASGVLADRATVEGAFRHDDWRSVGTRRVRGRNERVEAFAPRDRRDAPRRREAARRRR
jgi:adenylate cyclase